MTSQKNRTLTILVGAITALVVVFTQLFYYHGVDLRQSEIKTENQDKQDATDTPSSETQAFLSISASSVLSTFTIELSNKIVFLFEIVFEKHDRPFFPTESSLPLGKYFHTLFHIIISPNAP